MLYRLKLSIEKQLLTLASLILLSGLLSWFFEMRPRLRINVEMLGMGILGGAVICILLLLSHSAILYLWPLRHYPSLKDTAKELSSCSVLTLCGAGIVSGTGEELLFRTLVFSLLAEVSLWLAYPINFVLMAALYYRGREHFAWSMLKAAEFSCYALFYLTSRSFFMIAIAHLFVELTVSFVFRSAVIRQNLEKENLHISRLFRIFKKLSPRSRPK